MIKNLDKGLVGLDKYFRKWRVRINPTKTEAIFCTRRRVARYLPSRPVRLNGANVDWKNSVRYLGVHIDRGLTFKSHVDKAVEKNELMIKVLYPLIGRDSKLSLKNKILVFKQIYRPSLSFAAPVISQCATTHKKRLQVAQNKVIKIILGVPTRTPTDEIHDTCKLERINDFMKRLTDNFVLRTRCSTNPEMTNLFPDV